MQRFPTDLLDLAPNMLRESAESEVAPSAKASNPVKGTSQNDVTEESASSVDSPASQVQQEAPETPKLIQPPPARKAPRKVQNATSKPKAWGPRGDSSGGRKRVQQGVNQNQDTRASRPVRDQASGVPVRPAGNLSRDVAEREKKLPRTTGKPTAPALGKPVQRGGSDAATAYFKKSRKQPDEAQFPVAKDMPTNLMVGDIAPGGTGKGRKDKGSKRGKNQRAQGSREVEYGQSKRSKRRGGNTEGRFGGLNAENRRKARQQRQERRELRVVEQEREEIIEVGSEGIAVNDLASLLAVPPAEIVKVLFLRGIMSTVTQTLDMDTVKVVGLEYGVEIWDKSAVEVTDMAKKTMDFVEEDETDVLKPRPPVVTVMGHVDHGKVLHQPLLAVFLRKRFRKYCTGSGCQHMLLILEFSTSAIHISIDWMFSADCT